MQSQEDKLIEAAAEAVKLRDMIHNTLLPLMDGKPMGVITSALTGLVAHFIAGCPPHARAAMRDHLFNQIDTLIPVAVEVQKAHGNPEDRYENPPQNTTAH